MGVTPSRPVKANRGVRARVAAAGKALEGNDQQIYLHYITIGIDASVQLGKCGFYARQHMCYSAYIRVCHVSMTIVFFYTLACTSGT